MGLGRNGTGREWNCKGMELGGNGTEREWDWEGMGMSETVISVTDYVLNHVARKL